MASESMSARIDGYELPAGKYAWNLVLLVMMMLILMVMMISMMMVVVLKLALDNGGGMSAWVLPMGQLDYNLCTNLWLLLMII